MSANLMQAKLIERYATRHNMPVEKAACVWIRRNGARFRAYFNRRNGK